MTVPKGVTLYANGKRYKSGKTVPKGFDEQKVEAKGKAYTERTAKPKPKGPAKAKPIVMKDEA